MERRSSISSQCSSNRQMQNDTASTVYSSDFNRIGLKRRLPTDGASRTVRETMLRISGAVQVLEEELGRFAEPELAEAAPNGAEHRTVARI
jgi:hypothetical protein